MRRVRTHLHQNRPMSPRSVRRSSATVLAAVVAAVSVVACGSEAVPRQVATAAPAPTTSSVAPPTDEIAAGAGTGGAASTVDGLTAAELREAVEAPESAPVGRDRTSGPVAQRVRLASGATVWRVRIPGRFPVRSARVVVSVGGRQLGEGVPGSRLQSLVAVTRDAGAIVEGAAVTYAWAGGPTVPAGRLAVIR